MVPAALKPLIRWRVVQEIQRDAYNLFVTKYTASGAKYDKAYYMNAKGEWIATPEGSLIEPVWVIPAPTYYEGPESLRTWIVTALKEDRAENAVAVAAIKAAIREAVDELH